VKQERPGLLDRGAGGGHDGWARPRRHLAAINRPAACHVEMRQHGSTSMNVANLQLEGLLMAVASINNVLVRKGLLTVDEIDLALRKAEASLSGEERSYEDLTAANRDAVCFPLRLLQLANRSQLGAELPAFSELTRTVGRTKGLYNDQM
jgi:hypothetical protein